MENDEYKTKPRGTCPVCAKKIVLRKDGTLILHNGPNNKYYCKGSLNQRLPVEAGGGYQIPKYWAPEKGLTNRII